MDYLLDTETAIWAALDSDKLPQHIKDVIKNRNNRIFVSTISFWEIAIKHAKKPHLMPYSAIDIANAFYNSDFVIDDIRFQNIVELEQNILPIKLHNDPFDLAIIAQAVSNSHILITCDSIIKQYKFVNILSY